jgi:hypothetical protein
MQTWCVGMVGNVGSINPRREREKEVNLWLSQMIASLDQQQIRQLHFRELPDHKKNSISRQLASLDVRLFTFISHKKNMEGYRNIHAERAGVNKTAWFDVSCSKVLMESVTDFCGHRSRAEYGEPRIVKCEFSATGGVKLSDVRAYYSYIKEQARLGLSFKTDFPLDWDTIDPDQMFIYPNADRHGLQLSDIVASAFYSGLEYPPKGGLNPAYAKLLDSRIARKGGGKKFMYGIKFMPRWIGPKLPTDQRAIWDYYKNK